MPASLSSLSAATGPIRVLVVDDSALMRSLMAAMIGRQPDMTCLGGACDAHQAREMIRALDPDVITLDVAMPRMDGLDFLERLMRLRPTPVVLVSSSTHDQPELAARARALGACAVVDKPAPGAVGGLETLERELAAALRQAVAGRGRRAAAAPVPAAAASAPMPPAGADRRARLIVIGASTGGPEATPHVLRALSPAVPPVLIVQHIPSGFSARYAARLDTIGPLRVCEARDDQPLLPGHAYVAPGGRHLAVARAGVGLVTRISDDEPIRRHRPSVEVLFRSAAEVVGERVIGVMLTGMGGDGAAAMRQLRDAGAWNIAQDEATCAVFGMPKEAIRAGACQEVLPLQAIGPRVMALLGLAAPASAAIAAGGLRETAPAGR